MKKIISYFLVMGLVLACMIPAMSYSQDKVTVRIDGNAVSFTDESGTPFIDANSRTLVPLRVTMEAYGATVSWDDKSRVALVEKDGMKVEVPIGEKYILKNSIKAENDSVAVIENNRTYLPIRIVLESFGAVVNWEQATQTVVVHKSGTVTVPVGNSNQSLNNTELKAMWISYLEFGQMPKDKTAFQAEIDKMFDRCLQLGMNAVIVQVRPDSDAMYPSNYFPWSKFASGKQGVNPGYDPLAYMIEAAHSRNLQFHAWINPYRVTGYNMSWSEVSTDNPAKVWTTDSDPSNDRWVLCQKDFYYYNPSVPQVRELVVNGVKEIVEKYDIDGIHFDDYFYPSLNDKDPTMCFDKPEFDLKSSIGTISQWRRDNVNQLVQDVYKTVKATNKDIIFGISPAGNVENLRSNTNHFVDVDTWMSKDGYIDYIMPQLYWGFERKDSSGAVASYAYENNLKTWIDLKKKGSTKLYIGLNVANAGTNISDGNAVSEWLRCNDVLKRQVETARNSGEVSGYAFFRYASFDATVAQNEVNNLVTVLKK